MILFNGTSALYMPFRAMKIKNYIKFEANNSNKNAQMKHKTCTRLTRMYKWNKVYIKTTMISKHKHVNTMTEWLLEYCLNFCWTYQTTWLFFTRFKLIKKDQLPLKTYYVCWVYQVKHFLWIIYTIIIISYMDVFSTMDKDVTHCETFLARDTLWGFSPPRGVCVSGRNVQS